MQRGGEVQQIFLLSMTPASLEQCRSHTDPYRIALLVEGYQGATTPAFHQQGDAVGFVFMRETTFGYFVCALYATQTPKIAFYSHLGTLISNIFLWAQTRWAL